ncbi:MAG: MFS transporter, partial [Alphaproteobacteria bacterium]|nr:MFS transporter [Alphaproteobacteria bacterium]
GMSAELIAADAALWRPAAPADVVLLDAPCSATGTIRRHPDVPWLKTPENAAKLAEVQDRLLRAAVDMVKPGGQILFCTCSLEAIEGPERVTALLDSGAPVTIDPIGVDEVGIADSVTAEGFLRTLPNQWAKFGRLDGFFAVRLRRRT